MSNFSEKILLGDVPEPVAVSSVQPSTPDIFYTDDVSRQLDSSYEAVEINPMFYCHICVKG